MPRPSNDVIIGAAQAAIARAKRRGGGEVSPDDLLIGLLKGAARFGVAIIGNWAIDLEALGENWIESVPLVPPGAKGGPAYSPETAQIFDRAAAIASREGAGRVELIHLLAAFAPEEGGLMGRLKSDLGITEAGWREALARSHPPGRYPAGRHPAGWSGGGSHAPQNGKLTGEPGSGERDLLSPDEAADFLGVHTQTVRGYIRTGKLPAYRIGGERFIRIRRDDLLDLLEPLSPEDAGLPGEAAAK